jgi:Bacterial Ig-like domain (group 1)
VFSITKKIINRLLLGGAALTSALLLSGCGGSGAGAQGSAGGSTGAGAASGLVNISSLALLRSVPNATTSGKDIVTITALIKDTANNATPDIAVRFSSTDPGVSIAPKGTKTDASGKVEAEVTITGQTNRTITFTAQAESLTATTTVDVSGTRLSFVGPNTVVQSGTANYTLSLQDHSGTPIVDQTVTVVSALGNTVNLASTKTNSQGKVSLALTTTQAGADTLTATAAGATAVQSLAVSATDLQIVVPSQEYRVSTAETITVRMRQAGAPVAGALLRMSATRGALSASTVTTDGTGLATVTLTSATAGITTVSATAPDGTVATVVNEFISTTPNSVVLQASPSIVGVNLVTTGEQQASQLLAIVKDVTGNPVKGVRVDFSAVTDPSHGSIDSPGFATTDSTGSASLGFRPGADPTGNNEIVVQAKLNAFPTILGTTTLTAARQELDVELGSSNQIESPNLVTWRMPWRVAVTDSAGAPVKGVELQASLVSTRFYKGRWAVSVPPANPGWTISYPGTPAQHACRSEDLNGNGRMDAGEDANGDSQLTPGAAATVYFDGANAQKGITDQNGTALVWVEYARDKAWWVDARLRVSTTIRGGTESFGTREFLLPLPAEASGNTAITPNGLLGSPFGREAGCDNTN